MRAPLSWIRDFTPLDAPVADIADALNQLGLEVDDIDQPGKEIQGVIAARILDVVPHPDADKIRLADIEFGEGRQLRVVCGAPNIEAGMVVPFAQVGAVLPGDFHITKRKIRGVVSEGMLCSSRELGLGDDHSGILTLDASAELGRDVREILGLDDTIFELSITPNRPDAMGIVGVARDLAAHFSLPFEIPGAPSGAVADAIDDVRVTVEATDRCPRFVARVANVTMGPSPAWLQQRLTLAGMRPISNVVDVTNYIMLERCRPLHTFDLGRLAGRGIVVRLANDSERMTTLDGVERTLSRDDLLICDGNSTPQAIAGIMGGRDSEVDDNTTEVLIESAYFEPSGISKSSKRLGLRSEASARFERGIDPNGTAEGADAAVALLGMVAGATAAAETIDVYPSPVERPRIVVRTARVNSILGADLSGSEVRALIEPLGIETDGADESFTATCPTWRPDLTREIDVIEEVARRFGLNNIKRTVPSAPAGTVGRLTPEQRDRRRISDALVGAGFSECLTLPLVGADELAVVGAPVEALVHVANPLRAEEGVMRSSLRVGLLAAVARNGSRGNPDVALFEQGTVFAAPRPGDLLPHESTMLSAVLGGSVRSMPTRPVRSVDVADAVDAVHAVCASIGVLAPTFTAASLAGMHPARGAHIEIGNVVVGTVGEFDRDVLDALGIHGTVVGCDLDVAALLAAPRSSALYQPISVYPPANIDLAFIVDKAVPASAVAATLRENGTDLLESVRLFDAFASAAFGDDKVSLAFALRFRALDRTLTDEEVSTIWNAAAAAVERAHGAQLRR